MSFYFSMDTSFNKDELPSHKKTIVYETYKYYGKGKKTHIYY